MVTRLKREVWASRLSSHPDKDFAAEILQFIDFGVPLMYDGPILNQVFPNWKSCDILREEMKTSLLYDISRQWKIGPFAQQPFEHFVGSPMGAFSKVIDKLSNNVKTRVIHDLSWPPGQSVNSFIPAEPCSVHYVSVDDAVRLVKKCGKDCLMAKIDLKDAYKQIGVRQQDWPLLGSTWINDFGTTEYYFDTVLPFGCRSSAAQFDKFASALEFIMKVDGVTHMCHYLDDLFTCGSANSPECLNNFRTMLRTCDECGVEVNPKKLVEPEQCVEFLGIVIDSTHMELRMSEARLDAVKSELSKWIDKKSGAKRDLLSLLGKLVFLSRVITPGRVFMRRLFNLSMSTKHLHYKVKLNRDAREDIVWWLNCAEQWNKKSVFLDEEWTADDRLHMFTDASDVGIGGVFGREWFAVPLNKAESSLIIAWRELYAIVVACSTWGHHLTGRKLLIHCDNETVVAIVNSGTSKNRDIMCLVRILFFVCVRYNFDIRLVHVPGKENIAADRLSRLDEAAFFREFPTQYNRQPTPVKLQGGITRSS